MPDTQMTLAEAPKELVTLDPMAMIQAAFQSAIENKQGLEVVDRILEQQKWMIQHNEEQAFNAALKKIQRQLKKIPKRGWNDQTRSNYATAEDVDDAIQHLLDSENMTLTFVPAINDKPMMVTIIGTLSLGAYSRQYPLEMPTDGQGPKGGGVMTRTHATGSAVTYAKRYLKNMIFDLRFNEKDDDGNQAGAQGMEEAEFKEWDDKIGLADSEEELKRVYLAAQTRATELGAAGVVLPLAAAKNKRLKELRNAH